MEGNYLITIRPGRSCFEEWAACQLNRIANRITVFIHAYFPYVAISFKSDPITVWRPCRGIAILNNKRSVASLQLYGVDCAITLLVKCQTLAIRCPASHECIFSNEIWCATCWWYDEDTIIIICTTIESDPLAVWCPDRITSALRTRQRCAHS